MKHIQLFLLFSIASPGAWAQPVVGRDTGRDQTAPEHRRAELRLILREPRRLEAQPSKDQRFENVGFDRHLTVQERMDLRQQLRQQRLDGKPERP